MPNPPVGLSKRILILMKLAELVESEGTALQLKCYVNQSSFFWGGSYGLSNFDMFSKKGYDRHALNPCISGTDGSICTKQVLLERELHILVNYSFELEFDLEIDLVDQVI